MLRILVGPVPASLLVLSLICLYFYPLTTSVVAEHVDILKMRRDEQKAFRSEMNEEDTVGADASVSYLVSGKRSPDYSGSSHSSCDSGSIFENPTTASTSEKERTSLLAE